MCSHENRLIEAILMSTHNISYQYKKENHPKLMFAALGSFFVKNEFEIAIVNETSVFEPPEFYCITKIVEDFQSKLLHAVSTFFSLWVLWVGVNVDCNSF